MRIDSLDHRPNDIDERGKRNGIFPAKLVGKRVEKEARQKRAELVESDGERTHFGLSGGGIVEIALEGGVGEDSAGDARVVASEEGGDALCRSA